MNKPLAEQKCEACHGGTPPLDAQQIETYRADLVYPWEVKEGRKLRYPFECRDFSAAMQMANAIARIAEEEDHHPTMTIKPNGCTVVLTTHAIGGLSANDFIMAAKIEALAKA